MPIAVLCATVALVSCATKGEPDPDLTTTEGACLAVADAIELLKSADSDVHADGIELANRIWDYSATDDDVSIGMRMTCGMDVIEMLTAADIHPTD